MFARLIIAILGLAFLAAGAWGWRHSHPAGRTWLVVGLVFAAVSAWLWRR